MNNYVKSAQQWFGTNSKLIQGASAPMLVVAILAMMVLPLPPPRLRKLLPPLPHLLLPLRRLLRLLPALLVIVL